MATIRQTWRYAPLAVTIAALWLPATGYAQAQKSAPSAKPVAAAPAATTPTESQRHAREILMQMAQYVSKAPRLSVSIRGSYDAVQESGQKIEFGENRKVTLSRPDNRMRVESEQSDGTKLLTVFNGKEVTLIDSHSNVYATAAQSGSLDETIIYFVRDLGVRLPLAVLLLSRMPAELEQRVRSIDYVEKTTIYGAPAHHLAARTDSADLQIWINEGDKPVPVRIVITYRESSGEPQYRAQLTDWNLAPAVTDAAFAATPPKGAQKVAFVGQLARQSSAAARPADKATSKGGK